MGCSLLAFSYWRRPKSQQPKSQEPTVSEANATSPNTVTSNRLVMVFILIGLGIPILIEAVTLVRMIGGHLSGEDDGRFGAADSADVVVVDEGDELLPATAPTETIARASVRAQLNAWYFVFEVDVHNAADRTYELTLDELETRRGQMLREAHIHRAAPGDSTRIRVEWTMPEGDRPVSMQVSGRLIDEDGMVEEASHRVHFDRVPVRMRD